MTEPMITVVIAAYNASPWIVEGARSVLDQTLTPAELIVVDDGSTDDTAALVAELEPAIHLLRQPNRGAPAAYNRGFSEAQTPYVALCAADDVWEPDKLERQTETLRAQPDIDLSFGHMTLFGAQKGDYRRPHTGTGLLDSHDLLCEMFARNVLAAPTAVIRRETWTKLGGFREDLPGEDYEFWLRALRARAKVHYDPRPMVRYRLHGDSLSAQRWRMLEATYRVRREYAPALDNAPLVRKVLSHDAAELARYRRQAGLHEAARRAYREQLCLRPSVAALAWWLVLGTPAAERAGALRRRRRPTSTAAVR